MSKQVTSFAITSENNIFLKKYATNKSAFINKALETYKKYILLKELKKGFTSQTEEDVIDSMSDFENYLSIVDNN